MARFRVEVPAGVALRTVLYSEPRLAALEYEGTSRAATVLAATLAARDPALDPDAGVPGRVGGRAHRRAR